MMNTKNYSGLSYFNSIEVFLYIINQHDGQFFIINYEMQDNLLELL